MTRPQKVFFENLHKLVDVGLSVTAFWVAHSLKDLCTLGVCTGFVKNHNLFLVTLLVVVCWYLSLSFWGGYGFIYSRCSLSASIRKTAKAILAALVMLIVVLYLLKIHDVGRLELGLFFCINILFLSLSKVIIYAARFRRTDKPHFKRHILIVGAKERAKEVICKILADDDHNLTIHGCIEIEDGLVGSEVARGVKVLDNIRNLDVFLKTTIIDEIIFAMPLSEIFEGGRYVSLAEEMGVSVRIIPDWQLHHLMYRPAVARIDFEEFVGIPTMALHTTPRNEVKLFFKHVFDYCIAAVGLVLVGPLMLIIAGMIKIFDPGPVLFSQERCGVNGRRFRVYKFRTMVQGAEKKLHQLRELNEADGPVFKITNDPRIIPYIGKFLRKTGLDELPQLFNVLQGEMSIVGPRPPIPAEVNEYDTWHRRRLSMKPGITCTWQTQPKRNETSFEEWMRLDLAYIDNWNLWNDFKILLKTCKVLFLAEGR
ncbi:sugar transferase [Desulfogranum marinum]|uniref:sugar transferase n=1 Tax=Desulfogranum marinum TaxID=453220 RepID=UPI00196344AF|nr:sugar transferase [Desulfogranum marinum]MBM9514816.1 sugar transferase [Desulfogranum marinum]